MTRPPRLRRSRIGLLRLTSALLAVALLAGGCNLRTAGSPKGDLTLYAEFDDVHSLVVGHSVKLADITIGTVTKVELDGYRARVTMSIQDGHPLPVGTTAILAKTSLLGEQYINLKPPPGSLPARHHLLRSGDEITDTATEAEFEEVTERAIEFIGAVTAHDVNTIVSTGAQAFGGRGHQLHELLSDLSQVVVDLDSQRDQIAATIDNFAQMGHDLASHDDQVASLVDDLAGASVTLAANRDRMIASLRGIRDVAQVSTETVLVPHIDEVIATLRNLDPIVATLAGQRPLIESMLQGINDFLVKIANNNVAEDTGAAAEAQYVWARGVTTPSGTLGDAPPPDTPAAPSAPASGPDPRNSINDVNNLVGSILGLLGALPGVTLPPEVCQQLRTLQGTVDDTLALGLALQLPHVCPSDGSSGGSTGGGTGGGTTVPTLPVPVPGNGGGGSSSGGSPGVPLTVPGVGG